MYVYGMAIVDSYPLITVQDLPASRAFFSRVFGLRPLFEASWVVMFARGDTDSIALGLMSADHPSKPPGPETFGGSGMLVTLQVDDAAALHRQLTAQGIAIELALVDTPWGQRRFMLRDPSGIQVDVVEQIDPAPGFWDPYIS